MIRKKFKTIEEATAWLERQLYLATFAELVTQQLDYIDDAVLKSDLSQANEVINHIRGL